MGCQSNKHDNPVRQSTKCTRQETSPSKLLNDSGYVVSLLRPQHTVPVPVEYPGGIPMYCTGTATSSTFYQNCIKVSLQHDFLGSLFELLPTDSEPFIKYPLTHSTTDSHKFANKTKYTRQNQNVLKPPPPPPLQDQSISYLQY